MILKHLYLTNFKNIESCDLSFSDKLNCIIGDNGMGKTNLLDSIFYLSFTKSHLHVPDRLVLKRGEKFAILRGEYDHAGKKEQVSIGITYDPKGRKVIKHNGVAYTRFGDHIGAFPAVIIAPSDIDLIRGESMDRRKFMNQLISQEDNDYTHLAYDYSELVRNRNATLRTWKRLAEQRMTRDEREKYDVADMIGQYGDLEERFQPLLDSLEHQMADKAAYIVHKRADWAKRIKPLFLSYYDYITSSSDRVDILYAPSLPEETEATSVTAGDFLRVWQSTRWEDLSKSYTQVGPQRDELKMHLDGMLIRKIGSQGQNKSFMVALKFAQFKLFADLHPDNKPILLLDDVFDKLDEKRVDRIVRLVSGDDFGQIFMTDTNRKYLDQIIARLPETDHTILRVQDGQATILEEKE